MLLHARNVDSQCRSDRLWRAVTLRLLACYHEFVQVRPATRRSLENAARNRGIVVATPTTLKSIMLVYIETLRRMDELRRGTSTSASKEQLDVLCAQAKELADIVGLFKDGVMLLDEVDLILHPLKSELNFPIGEKFDLDGSEQGERWSLPMHLLDAIFYADSGRSVAFEARGMALDILKRISVILNEGYALHALQRLPHVTLLNTEWYQSTLKPLMAEWVYLWLQKQHLHGIHRHEAVTYMLEGAGLFSSSQSVCIFHDSCTDSLLKGLLW